MPRRRGPGHRPHVLAYVGSRRFARATPPRNSSPKGERIGRGCACLNRHPPKTVLILASLCDTNARHAIPEAPLRFVDGPHLRSRSSEPTSCAERPAAQGDKDLPPLTKNRAPRWFASVHRAECETVRNRAG